mmetsp:Transcript_14214/g.39142  ORF Transcript_14214/g.39142 Transcript_14214/m.39142 type:complete len:354 (-) Transcript_14214:627-1688(-)
MSLTTQRSGKKRTVMRATNVSTWKELLLLSQRQPFWRRSHCFAKAIATLGVLPNDALEKLMLFLKAALLKDIRCEVLVLPADSVATSPRMPPGSDTDARLDDDTENWSSAGSSTISSPLVTSSFCVLPAAVWRSRSPMKSRNIVVISSSPRRKATSKTVFPSESVSTGLACAMRRSLMMHGGARSTALCRNLGSAPCAMRAVTAGRFVCKIASKRGGLMVPLLRSADLDANSATSCPEMAFAPSIESTSKDTAHMRAERPLSSTGGMNAPCSRRTSAARKCLCSQALAKGVAPLEQRALRLAWLSTMTAMTLWAFSKSGRLLSSCKSVTKPSPFFMGALIDAPHLIMLLTISA